MFTSLLNTVCAYDPVGLGVPYNHLLFNDSLEPLVEAALQILIVTLDHDTTAANAAAAAENEDVSFRNTKRKAIFVFCVVYIECITG